MEERELAQRFQGVFDDTIAILRDVEKGFSTENESALRSSHDKFKEMLKSRIPLVEELIGAQNKGAVEKKFLELTPSFQLVASALENLIDRMEIKVSSRVLFSQKAKNDIRELYELVESQVRDVRDYLLTRNPHLKQSVQAGMDTIVRLVDDFALVHLQRLITGVCMPQASYLYIDMTDSMKRIARGLAAFTEKL
jgi:Na+/phosphate symporter